MKAITSKSDGSSQYVLYVTIKIVSDNKEVFLYALWKYKKI